LGFFLLVVVVPRPVAFAFSFGGFAGFVRAFRTVSEDFALGCETAGTTAAVAKLAEATRAISVVRVLVSISFASLGELVRKTILARDSGPGKAP
jgi:hypothetical protein